MWYPICGVQFFLLYQGGEGIKPLCSDFTFHLKLFSYEVDIGLAPDVGSLSYLPKITGNQSLIRELTYTARLFFASEAEKLGLVSKVVEGGRDEVLKSSLELAKFIATKSPIAVSGSKHLLTHSRDHRSAPNISSLFHLFTQRSKYSFSSFFFSLPAFLTISLTPVHGTLQL